MNGPNTMVCLSGWTHSCNLYMVKLKCIKHLHVCFDERYLCWEKPCFIILRLTKVLLFIILSNYHTDILATFTLLSCRICSFDGVPFLMHDRTLQRTTNIQEVFPNLTDTPAAMFTWAELESLNAGTWFLSVSKISLENCTQ